MSKLWTYLIRNGSSILNHTLKDVKWTLNIWEWTATTTTINLRKCFNLTLECSIGCCLKAFHFIFIFPCYFLLLLLLQCNAINFKRMGEYQSFMNVFPIFLDFLLLLLVLFSKEYIFYLFEIFCRTLLLLLLLCIFTYSHMKVSSFFQSH